jgi:phosphatidylglycerophosphatase A
MDRCSGPEYPAKQRPAVPRRGVEEGRDLLRRGPWDPVPPVLAGLIIETSDPMPESTGPARRIALALATACGAGYSPIAPGTAGSAVGVVLFVPLSALGTLPFAVVVAGLLATGIWAADEAERHYGREDDGRIVIDEVVGQLLTLAPLLWIPGARTPAWLVTGFVVFRWLDIWKPGPVRQMERRLPGGAGVMMDDVLAGLIGAVLLGAAAWAVEIRGAQALEGML